MTENSISVVIPAYNEALRIPSTIRSVSVYLKDRFGESEIIVIDDGSTDGTASAVRGLAGGPCEIRLLKNEGNRGKGYSTRKGVLSSKGALVLMTDADLSTPVEELEKLVAPLREGFDAAIGSRGLKESEVEVRQPRLREGMGKAFNLLVRALVIGGFKDTQCGFKLFRGDAAREVFSKSKIEGFGFDVEVLLIARLMGYRVKEVPVRWLNSPNSKVRLLRAPAGMFLELLKIRLNLLRGFYGR